MFFVDKVRDRVSKAMGCFFGCFRIRDDRSHANRPVIADSHNSSNSTEPVILRNRLSSLFLSEEIDDSPRKNKENDALGSPKSDTPNSQLKKEAKFLKACGTIPETPAEIRKACQMLEHPVSNNVELDASDFYSSVPDACVKRFSLDKPSEQFPTPIQMCEGGRKVASCSSEDTPCSCISDLQLTNSVDVGFKVQHRNKSVRFDCKPDVTMHSSSGSSSEHLRQNLKKFESPGNCSVSKPSPYPTPLRLTDEMQTPGTVFPANFENLETGKNTRIRSQYVYSVMNPIENSSQWKVLKEEEDSSPNQSGDLRESLEQPECATPTQSEKNEESTVMKGSQVDASLASWLKPPISPQNGYDQEFKPISTEPLQLGRTPGDRPILGTVATHWNEDELSRVSPKWWDGNGIPNSTNKYKEDQKVNWHATPFEVRLEKALSEESFQCQRKPTSATAMILEENEEIDTAASQIQPLNPPKSVVSF